MAIEFNEEDILSQDNSRNLDKTVPPKLVRWMVDKGIVNDPNTSYLILVIIIISCLVLAAVIFAYFTLGIGRKETVNYQFLPGTENTIPKKN